MPEKSELFAEKMLLFAIDTFDDLDGRNALFSLDSCGFSAEKRRLRLVAALSMRSQVSANSIGTYLQVRELNENEVDDGGKT